jgi:tryptophan-rich sensory protein
LDSVASSKAVGALAVFAGLTALGNYWNVTFFGRRQMRKSVKVMAAFWGSVVATIAAFGAVDKNAGALVAPTIVWVTIATMLNATVVKLNPGKGAKED